MRYALQTIATFVFTAGLTAACAQQPKCPEAPKCAPCPEAKACPKCPEAPKEAAQEVNPRLPAFVVAAITGPHADRAKLYIDDSGAITKVTAYVARAGVPDWVPAAADEAIGAGEDKDYEVEQYADGTQAYEVTRRVGGEVLEVSFDAKTKIRRYVEKKNLPLESMPDVVKQAASAIEGLKLTEYATKEKFGEVSHEVYGTKGGKKWVAVFKADGARVYQREYIPATLRLLR